MGCTLYNTGQDDFPYHDTFRHSSWLSMVQDRLELARGYLSSKGVIFASIDAVERGNLETTLNNTFGIENRVEELIWVQNTTKNRSPTYSTNHEYVEVYARDIKESKNDARMFREVKPGFAEIKELIDQINPHYPLISEVESKLRKLFDQHRESFAAELEEQGIEYDKNIDQWRGLYSYSHAEYRDEKGRFVSEGEAVRKKARIYVWASADCSMPQVKEDSQKQCFRDPKDPSFRFFKPLHPTKGKPTIHPKTGWRWPMNTQTGQTSSFSALDADNRIDWGTDEKTVPRLKKFLHEVETSVAKSVVPDYTDGEKELAHLFGRSRAFSNPKPTTLISRFIQQTTDEGEWVMDFFPGSGTTGHAVLNALEADTRRRRFLMMEVADHFDTTLLPRIKKVFAVSRWKDGKPVTRPRSKSLSSEV